MMYSLLVTLHANDRARTRMHWAAPMSLPLAEIGGLHTVTWKIPVAMTIRPADFVVLVQCYRENKRVFWCEFLDHAQQAQQVQQGTPFYAIIDLDAFLTKVRDEAQSQWDFPIQRVEQAPFDMPV